MYRLLIVDDEPIIADALFEVFKSLSSIELDVCRVYSGNAALEWLNQNKTDIVLSDIRMPGMDGIGLVGHIRRKWPQCRVILLTGYNEFEYVYRAIQYKGVSYLLKTEGYDKVIRAVEDAAAEINKSLKMEDILNKANEQIALTYTLLQKEFFLALINGEIVPCDVNPEQFMQLGIPLRAEMPILMLAGRITNFPGGISYVEKTRNVFSIKLIAEQYFSSLTNSVCIMDGHSDLIWFLQPKGQASGNEANDHEPSVIEPESVFIKGMLETIQESCRQSLNISISFSLSNQVIFWNCCTQEYTRLKQHLDYCIVPGAEMLLNGQYSCADEKESKDARGVLLLQTSLRKTGTLNTYLERGQESEFFLLFDELAIAIREITSMYTGSALEIYYSISLMFLSFINCWNLTEEIPADIGLGRLTHIEQQASWEDSIHYFKELAEAIFTIQENRQKKRAENAIAYIEKYVEDNIQYELSLSRLAELVYFNSSYLSRLFKQVKGENLSEYILHAKIKKAKLLLERPEIKIHEVAEAVGYNTAQNFTRFFKKNTGKTPQEYRDMVLYITGKQMSLK